MKQFTTGTQQTQYERTCYTLYQMRAICPGDSSEYYEDANCMIVMTVWKLNQQIRPNTSDSLTLMILQDPHSVISK